MHSLIQKIENSWNLSDAYQGNIILSFINSEFFVWTCFVLLLSHKNWKRPVIIILILHWFFRSLGDCFHNSSDFFEKKVKIWPHNNKGYFYSLGVASIFWYASEIMGDWYPLLRTKAIIKNKRKIKFIYLICILFNLVKLVQMSNYLFNVPFRKGYDIPSEELEKLYDEDNTKFTYKVIINTALQQLFSLTYDISVIIALRKNVFNEVYKDKKERYKHNEKDNDSESERKYNFLKKFKQLSEYRIYVSMVLTIIGIILMIVMSFFIVYANMHKDKNSTGIDYSIANSIREMILNFNYNLMYIDQILLRYVVEKSKYSDKCINLIVKPDNTEINETTSILSYSQKIANRDYKNYCDYKRSSDMEIANNDISLLNHNQNPNESIISDGINPNQSTNDLLYNQRPLSVASLSQTNKMSILRDIDNNYYLNSLKNKNNSNSNNNNINK